MQTKRLTSLVGQYVCITYIDADGKNVTTNAHLVEVDHDGIAYRIGFEFKALLYNKIEKIETKNITFVSPKKFFHNKKEDVNTLNIFMDNINTQTIERIKNLSTYYLCTRNARFVKNGSFIKTKISQKQFELEVFDWIKKRKDNIELCPLALLNNELLLVVYEKRFLLLRKNFKIVFDTDHQDINTIVNFILEQNSHIMNKRERSLRSLAEELL